MSSLGITSQCLNFLHFRYFGTCIMCFSVCDWLPVRGSFYKPLKLNTIDSGFHMYTYKDKLIWLYCPLLIFLANCMKLFIVGQMDAEIKLIGRTMQFHINHLYIGEIWFQKMEMEMHQIYSSLSDFAYMEVNGLCSVPICRKKKIQAEGEIYACFLIIPLFQ